MQISIAGYSFHGLLARRIIDVFGYLEACRYRYSLHTADIWAGLMGKEPDVFLADGFIANVREAIERRELSLVNYHVDRCHVWEEDVVLREKYEALAGRHIAAAEKLGAKTVRIDPGGSEREWSAEAFDCIARRYRDWAKRAHDNGYRIGPERHWGAGNHVDNLLKLTKAVDSPGFGILLHMGKDADGDPAAADRALVPYAMHTHLSAEVCAGSLDQSLAILKDAKYAGAIGIEHHSGVNEYESVALQLAQVRSSLVRGEGARS